MSAGRGIPVLRIDVSASHRLAAALALAHAMALGSVLVAVPQWTWRLFAALVLGASAWRTIARHALRLGAPAVVRLTFQRERECSLERRDGRRVEGCVLDSSFVATWLVVLHLRVPGRRRPHCVVLLPDSSAPAALRRLRVRLRWTRAAAHEARGGDPSL